jgi:hypothetical protein
LNWVNRRMAQSSTSDQWGSWNHGPAAVEGSRRGRGK